MNELAKFVWFDNPSIYKMKGYKKKEILHDIYRIDTNNLTHIDT